MKTFYYLFVKFCIIIVIHSPFVCIFAQKNLKLWNIG